MQQNEQLHIAIEVNKNRWRITQPYVAINTTYELTILPDFAINMNIIPGLSLWLMRSRYAPAVVCLNALYCNERTTRVESNQFFFDMLIQLGMPWLLAVIIRKLTQIAGKHSWIMYAKSPEAKELVKVLRLKA